MFTFEAICVQDWVNIPIFHTFFYISIHFVTVLCGKNSIVFYFTCEVVWICVLFKEIILQDCVNIPSLFVFQFFCINISFCVSGYNRIVFIFISDENASSFLHLMKNSDVFYFSLYFDHFLYSTSGTYDIYVYKMCTFCTQLLIQIFAQTSYSFLLCNLCVWCLCLFVDDLEWYFYLFFFLPCICLSFIRLQYSILIDISVLYLIIS
jgi:hypothetical protein